MEVTSRLVSGPDTPGGRLGELHEFVTLISDINGVVLCDVQ